MKLRVGLLFPILLTFVIPILSAVLFPKGNEELSVCVMLLYALIAGVVLGTDRGIWLWLLCVFEAALWPVLITSAPTLDGDLGISNIVWLGGKLLGTICFCLVFSGFFGLPLRHIIRKLKADD